MTEHAGNEPTEVMILAGLNAYSSKGLEIDGYETTEEYPSLEMWGDRFASQMRAALVAAQGAAPPVNSFDTTAERVKKGADSLHVAPQELCPQPCEHLSAEDAREGRDCREHPCTCPTALTSDREKLIEEARAVVPQAETPQCGPCRRGQHGCCDGNEYLRCECSHGAAPVLPSSGVDEDALAKYGSRQKQETTNYREWKRQNRGYGIPELLAWAREAQDNVRFAAG